MPLFGEIVIPSSRILWDDDYDLNSTEIKKINCQWDHETLFSDININNLIVIETSKLTDLGKQCLVSENTKTFSKIAEAKTSIYKLSDDNYMILIDENEDITPGEITEKLIQFITKSKNIILFTSAPSATFQSESFEEKPSCFIRSIMTGAVKNYATRLEAPNLATGVTAGVLSYCHHVKKSAVLYMCYLEPRPLDSVSAQPILNILQNHQIPIINTFKVKISTNDSNLYM